MLTKIDELNTPKYEAISYEEYFAPMDIPEEDKEKRVKMAEEIDDIYFDFFAQIATMVALNEYLDWDYLNDYLNTRLHDTFEDYEYSATRDYISQYADLSAENTVRTTLDHQGEEYYLSDERASRLAAENAQTIANYTELEDAILSGFTHKTWKAEVDRKTRREHRDMNGNTIRIEEYFKFSDCEMLMPHDEINGSARQCANCRCSLGFTTQENAVDENRKGDIIEPVDDIMLRDKSDNRIEPMPKKQFQRIVKGFKRQGGEIRTDDEAVSLLDAQNADGITFNKDLILLRPRPSRSSVFEELIHSRQYREGRNDGSAYQRISCEIEAKEKLLKYSKQYHLTNIEIDDTKKSLKSYKEELKRFEVPK